MIAAAPPPTVLEAIGVVITLIICFVLWHLMTGRLPLPRRRGRRK